MNPLEAMLGALSCCEGDFPTTTETDAIELDDTSEVTVASEIGSFSCCEAWFHVPEAWIDRVTLRMYGRVGKARVLLAAMPLDQAVATGEPGLEQSGVAISIRGTPCHSFELTCQATAGATLSDGRFYLLSWHAPVAFSGAVNREAGAPAAGKEAISVVLVARDADSGELKEVTTDSSGRLRTVRDVPPPV